MIEYQHPAVMGILNVTPDSFYAGSRAQSCSEIRRRTVEMIREGADIIDVGAYSTRPGYKEITEEEELRRLDTCMKAVRAESAEIPVAVDTFRAWVAEKAITEMGADIINDISGMDTDERMMETVVKLNVPYILTHSKGINTSARPSDCSCNDFLTNVISDMARKVTELQLSGLNDLIIDPGFGFSKTLEQNYMLLTNMELLGVFHLPVLVGISRKSMITRLLDIKADDALTGTITLNTIALTNGASILRVHDVKAARETIKIHEYLQSLPPC